ncbi:hypothetical protein GGR01_003726 [Acetobacter oeni]|nr:hypothetical protein [Acetobacter oeni]
MHFALFATCVGMLKSSFSGKKRKKTFIIRKARYAPKQVLKNNKIFRLFSEKGRKQTVIPF